MSAVRNRQLRTAELTEKELRATVRCPNWRPVKTANWARHKSVCQVIPTRRRPGMCGQVGR